MAAGKITLQANDGKTLSLVAPEGMIASTTEVVTTPVVINNATSKTTPADNDEFALLDSATTFSLKKLTFANLKARLLSYFDTFYSRTSAIFGIGQTWQNVLASRATNTTYTNTTGKPIQVYATIQGSGVGSTYALGYVNGVEICLSWGSYTSSGSGTGAAVTFTVPPDSTYAVDKAGSSSTSLVKWSELR